MKNLRLHKKKPSTVHVLVSYTLQHAKYVPGMNRRDFYSWSLSWIIFPQAAENRSFKIFRKFAEIFASQGAPLVSKIPGANLPTVSTTPRGKIAAGINNTGGKFATGINTTKFCHQFRCCCWYRWLICHLCCWYLVNISANFRKNQNDPSVIYRGLGEDDSWKTSDVKILWHSPFTTSSNFVAGVVDTVGEFAPWCCWYQWCTLTCKFSKYSKWL